MSECVRVCVSVSVITTYIISHSELLFPQKSPFPLSLRESSGGVCLERPAAADARDDFAKEEEEHVFK